MFSLISIKGFRGFKNLNVSGLDRFNLFIGRNNVGKTAVLESLFLLAGATNPELPLRVNILRGIEPLPANPEELWGWLFYGKNLDSEIALEVETETHKRRYLKLKLSNQQEIRLGGKRKNAKIIKHPLITESTVRRPTVLALKYHDEHDNSIQTKAFLTETGVSLERVHSFSLPNSIYVTSKIGYSPENPERFSRLQEIGQEDELLLPLRILEPRLTKLSVLVKETGPIICGDIGINKMVPLPVMGEGMGRLLTILLAISESKGAVVMVDEIDIGFHYSVMAAVWTAVAGAARRADVQVFATTHSWECLKSAHKSFSDNTNYDLRVHRLDRVEDVVTSTVYDKEMMEIALSSGMELR